MAKDQDQAGDGRWVVVAPTHALAGEGVGEFRQALMGLASGSGVVVDLSGVPFVDSAGLSALAEGLRRMREHGGEVAVACPRPGLRGVLESQGFGMVAMVAGSMEDALAALGGERS